ncbi:hypothetical protein PHYBOEH_003691 [Phytophthora boehmeriae]|uniref:MPN domain-containing protein n=1 Tax=Phytophthora boehmeriae TaxID=109152 RepID=A0A8T1WV21_9STRA|nr:hypothetical protein PHYBOEH_003691 [Phytophthora boehmeriae]
MVAPGARKPKGKLDAAAQTALQARHEALALVEERFRDFDVVWAKVHGFPWWPGVLFHSWDVVRRAGIRTDPKLVASLVVPPPEKILVLDAATGEETSAYRIRRHCLVMFLDKFNFSVVEIDPRNVASFTAHYQLYQHAVMGRKKGPKTDFRRAVMKATSLLHLGEEYAVEDLVMLEEPTPAEKKRRLEMSVEEEETEEVEQDDVASLEDAWDDQEADKDAEFLPVGAHDDKASENATVVFPNNRRKAQVASRRRSQKAKTNTAADSKKLRTATVIKKSIASTKRQSAKQSHVERPYAVAEITAGVELVTPVKSQQKAPAKESKTRARKSSRKDGHSVDHIAVVSPSPSPIDLTNTPDSEQKKYRAVSKDDFSEIGSTKPSKTRKKKMNGKITATESKKKRNESVKALVSEVDGDCDHNANLDADVSKTAEQDTRVLTPLSSIWTTAVSGHQRGEAHTQLAHKQDFLWDDAVFTDDISIAEKEKATLEREQAELAVTKSAPGRERALSKRQPRSVQQSQIRQNLMTGNLDPHTMVQCASYRPKDFVEDPNSRSRGGPNLDSPFRVLMHPDAVFVADLHAHLATCEIIGFLGGKWDESTKTLYIQAAFPCRSLEIDGDDGSTDVEMDPGSEIELRGIIENAHLEVVGWYHSHPAFAPDPSVRDIENQTSYQQLFQRPSLSKSDDKGKMPSEPFVGLIVGTYDTRRSTPVSLFRYFHVRGEKVSGVGGGGQGHPNAEIVTYKGKGTRPR